MGTVFNFEPLQATVCERAVKEVEGKIQQAMLECGNGGYTGSLAEATGVEVCTPKIGIHNDLDAEAWLYDNCYKWDDAKIIKGLNGRYYVGAQCSD